MFQKEVAERIMAPINTKDYGRLSILSQLNCKIEKLMDLNPNCFTPAPKIWSSVLLFRPLENRPSAQELKKLEHLTTLAFSQRRKMVRQSLKSINGISEKLESLGIEETRRAEQISPQEYLKLANFRKTGIIGDRRDPPRGANFTTRIPKTGFLNIIFYKLTKKNSCKKEISVLFSAR